jgi:hypothetical protein
MTNSSGAHRPGSRAASVATLALVLQLLAPTAKNVSDGFITPAARSAVAARSRVLSTQSSGLDKTRRHDATMLRSSGKRVIVVSVSAFLLFFAIDDRSSWPQKPSLMPTLN